jgi:hypothetical protein
MASMSVPAHVTPLRLVQRVPRDPGSGCPPSGAGDLSWLGTEVAPATPGTRRFLTDLTLPVRGGKHEILFRKAAFVDIGEFTSSPRGCEVEVGWRSSSMAPLFPVFAGRLVMTQSEVILDGFYAPPGGQVGAVLDRAFLNIAARGTARWFIERVGAALAGELRDDRRPAGSAYTEPSSAEGGGRP